MEEVKFKNTSRINTDELSIFQNYALKQMLGWVSAVFILLFGALAVGLFFWNTTAGIVCVVCGLFGGVVLVPYLLKENLKKQNEQILGKRKYLNTFEFYEDYVDVSSSATKTMEDNNYEEVGSQKLYYADLFKFVTYKDRLFIFINERQSFILDYKGMTKGTIGELIEFLKFKGLKFKIKSV